MPREAGINLHSMSELSSYRSEFYRSARSRLCANKLLIFVSSRLRVRKTFFLLHQFHRHRRRLAAADAE